MTSIRLQIGALAGGHYPLFLTVDEAAPVTAELPRADAERVAAEVGAVLEGGAASVAQLRQAGRDLLALLLRDAVATAWADAQATGGATTIRVLLDVEPEALRALPWELARTAKGQYLFVGGSLVMARGAQPSSTTSAKRLVVPVRVLVVVGDPHEAALRPDDELDAVFAALGGHPGEWHVEVACAPKQDEFFTTLEAVQPHILHFIGHSHVDVHTGDAGLRIRPGHADDAWTLTGELVQNVVDEAPRLVFLNACRTAHESAVARGVATAFSDLGALAVIAMQGDIPSASAVVFTRAVYTALAHRKPVDVAVQLARKTLMKTEQPIQRDWALPTLTVHTPPDQVLPVCMERPLALIDGVFERYLEDVRSFVDRSAKHREIWEALRPDSEHPRLVTLDGPQRSGKTTLTHCCLRTLSMQGRPVVYANLAPHRESPTLRWLNVLCHIRDAVMRFLPDDAAAPRAAFDRALWFYRHGREIVDDREEVGDTPAATIWQPGSEHEPRLREAVFAAFLEFLREVSGERPLVLAVDHVRKIDGADVDTLADGLLRPLAKGVAGIRVVLVDTSEQLAQAVPNWLLRQAKPVTLPLFTGAETIRIFREFGARRDQQFTGAWETFAHGLVHVPSWEPATLHQLDSVVRTGRLR